MRWLKTKFTFWLILIVVAGLILLVAILAGEFSALKQHLQARSQVNNVSFIDDPKKFVKEFNPEGKNPVQLEIFSAHVFWGGGRLIKSPLHPYTKLETVEVIHGECYSRSENGRVSNLSREGRNIDLDPFWKVFWVEIIQCGVNTRFFGPYRYTAI